MHLMESVRPGQRRGIPLIAPIVELALTLDRYMKAEAIAAQIQAMFTLVITSQTPDAAAGEMSAMMDDEYTGDDDSLIALGPGIVQYARPGESVNPVNPSRPTTAFESFINSTLQMCGPSVGMPYELLMQKFDASYSASRAAMNMANSNFKVKRAGLVHDFCQPVYEAFMDEAVGRGWIPARGYWDNPITRKAYTRAEWNGPGMPQIDILKEAMASEKLIALGISTHAREARETNGTDWYANIEEIGREKEAAKNSGITLPLEIAAAKTAGSGQVQNGGVESVQQQRTEILRSKENTIRNRR